MALFNKHILLAISQAVNVYAAYSDNLSHLTLTLENSLINKINQVNSKLHSTRFLRS